jgi:hypothetical protein
MTTTTEYRRLVDSAYQALSQVGGDPARLSEPFRTVVVVDTAKGIIDNGGIEYFFESSFPLSPDYSAFSLAFRNIGMREAADDLDRAVAQFPFPNPHLNAAMRNEFLRGLEPDRRSSFLSAGDRIMNDPEFDSKVLSYANRLGFSAG